MNNLVPIYHTGKDLWLDVLELGMIAPTSFDTLPATSSTLRELFSHLFEEPEPSPDELLAWDGEPLPPASTYALLDAAILPQLPEILEASGLEYRSLFTGKALEDLGDSAPWLVRLEADHKLTRQLLRSHETGGFWDLHLGLYLRSRQPLDAVWRHLRKFTRVQNEAGQWFFNRFWSAPVSTGLLQLGNAVDLVQFVSPLFPGGRDVLRFVVVSAYGCAVLSRKPGTTPTVARPILTDAVQFWLRHLRRVYQFEELIVIALSEIDQTTPVDRAAWTTHLRGKRDAFFDIGFWRRDHLTMLCVWEVMLGPEFIETYGSGRMTEILMTSSQDWEAIQRISEELDPPQEPTEAEIIAQLQALELAKISAKTER